MVDVTAFENWMIGSEEFSSATPPISVRAVRFLSRFMDVDLCTQQEMMGFVRSHIQKGRRHKTIENELHALKRYRKWTGNPIDVIRLRRQRNAETWVPQDSDIRQLFIYVDSVSEPSKKAFYRALIYALAFTGARIGEIASLQLEDVMERELGIYIRAEKSEASRTLRVPQNVISVLMDYVRVFRPRTDQRALFTGPKGKMSADRLRLVVKKIGREAGIPRLHSHAFRHRVATSLFNAGADLREVQQWLGHIEASSTRVYDHADRAQVYRKNADLLEGYYLRARESKEFASSAGTSICTRGGGFEPPLS